MIGNELNFIAILFLQLMRKKGFYSLFSSGRILIVRISNLEIILQISILLSDDRTVRIFSQKGFSL